VPKTYEEINEKIRQGRAVVVNAEELTRMVRARGVKRTAREVDVVTTGTFGAMCSSGAFLNLGHSKPRMKMGGGLVTLNGVPAYNGLAAVDLFIGATAIPADDPKNAIHPGAFRYGGGHVIEDLVAGRDVELVATAYGTDCYPRKALHTLVRLADLNEAFLFNPRNCYQNYNVAINLSDRTIYTYMGTLRPHGANVNYSTAGALSPLLCDPYYRTIGVGTRILLGGGVGYVVSHGTQHNPGTERGENGVPKGGAGTLALTGDMKGMNPRYVRGGSFLGYGATLFLGIAIPIPLLDEQICAEAAVSDEDIVGAVIDYSGPYPNREGGTVGYVTYAALKSGTVKVAGKEVPSFPVASYPLALEMANLLKEQIASGAFTLTRPVAPLPGVASGHVFRPLTERPVE